MSFPTSQVVLPEPITALAWCGDGILAAVPGGYKLIQSGCKVTDIAPGVTSRTLVASCPALRQALLVFADSMLLIVDEKVREGVLLIGGCSRWDRIICIREAPPVHWRPGREVGRGEAPLRSFFIGIIRASREVI